MIKKIKKYGVQMSSLLIILCTLFTGLQSYAYHGYQGNHTTGTGRDRIMRPARSYRHWQDQDKMSRWKNSPWFATDDGFPSGYDNNPSVDRYSRRHCPGGVCY